MGMTNEEKLIIIIIVLIVGWTIGLWTADYIWVNQRDAYINAKHQYEYCPYCGEYIGE